MHVRYNVVIGRGRVTCKDCPGRVLEVEYRVGWEDAWIIAEELPDVEVGSLE